MSPRLVCTDLKILSVVQNVIQRKLAAQITNDSFLDIDMPYDTFSSSYFIIVYNYVILKDYVILISSMIFISV